MDVSFIHREESFVVVDKPSGMIVHRGLADDAMDVMRAVRNVVGSWVYPVHRLDRGTSGALVMALDPETAKRLGKAFEAGRVEKRYLALTRGRPEDGEIDHPVPKAEDGPRVAAVTRVRCLGVAGRYALVEAVPLTGRMHQIRRHLKHVSCPIIGDVKYGKGEHNRHFRYTYGLHRLALHATELAFEHPVTGERLRFSSPLDGALKDTVAALGLSLPA
ncbi:MAG TPA: pseudouridine synthase [Polyangiaceae bacterium]|nr:pseudouridine synthase [Polyangiaceae bacterium]